jgi:hypothetical protein
MVAPEQAADVVASSPTDAPSTAPRENPARRQSVRRAPSNSCQRGVRGAVGEAAVRIKPGTYARVPIWAAALGISGRAWDVLVAICMHVDNGALAYPSMKTIAGIVGIQRCKVPAEIKKLVAAGVLRKTDRKDERHGDPTSSLYRVIFEPTPELRDEGTPVACGGNTVLPPAEARGVPRGGTRTDQFRTDQGTDSPPPRAGGNGFCLDAYQPDVTTMAAWAAENVPDLDDPLNEKTIADFKDHYRKTWTEIVDPDAAFRRWLKKEPYFRSRDQRARQQGSERNKVGSMLDGALDELRRRTEAIDG